MESFLQFLEENTEDLILGDILSSTGMIPCDQLAKTVAQHCSLKSRGMTTGLSQLVVQEGYVTQKQLASIIPGYVLLEKIGESKLAIRYKALQISLKRMVIIKILNPNLVEQTVSVTHFLHDMYALGKLDHPQMLRGIDSGKIADLHYVVTEYFDGTTLDQYIKGHGHLSENETLFIAGKLLSLLIYLWQHELIHRELIPQNVMIRGQEVKLFDFAWIKVLKPGYQTTFQWPNPACAFMSLEQMKGETLDYRSDMYSLGSLMYFSLTGMPPRSHLVNPIQLSEIPPIASVASYYPQISAETEKLIIRLLEPSPEQRFSSSKELQQTFNHVLKKKVKLQPTKNKWQWLLFFIFGMMIFGCFWIWHTNPHSWYPQQLPFFPPTTSPLVTPASLPTSIASGSISQLSAVQIYQRCASGVVLLQTEGQIGSGVLLIHQGQAWILTNAHVVEDHFAISVWLYDGSQYQGEVYKLDRGADLAIVKITWPDKIIPTVLELCDHPVIVGEDVLVIGHPHGYRWSLTRGTISGLRKDILQTDASINPGNSGGPVLNSEGRMIGLTAFVVGPNQSIGFAITVPKIRQFLSTVQEKKS